MNPILLQSDICTSCTACVSVCPKHHLCMLPDSCGFLYPSIIEETTCTDCNLCSHVCPLLNDTLKTTSKGKAYAASLIDRGDLCKSASGGVATALSAQIIKNHGLVYGVSYTPSFDRAEFQKTSSLSELERFRGSKYIQADKGDIFSDIKNELILDRGRDIIFIGLPCETAGLISFLGKKYCNLVTVDLICFGATSPSVSKEYADFLKKKFCSNLLEFTVRFKKDGNWTPPYLRAKFENGCEFLKPFYGTEYGKAFNLLPRKSCFSCKFKGENHISDLTIGDFWGCTETDLFWNPSGVSVIVAHSEKGLNLLRSLTSISLTEISYERALEKNPMYFSSRKENSAHEKFRTNFADKGLMYAVKRSISLKEKMITYARNRLPSSVMDYVTYVYHRFISR